MMIDGVVTGELNRKRGTEKAAKLVVEPGTYTARVTRRLGRRKTAELKNLNDNLSKNYKLSKTPGASTPARCSRLGRWEQLAERRKLDLSGRAT